MKFTEQDKAALYRATFPAVIALRFTKAPAPRDGEAKTVSVDFAAAVWTKRYVEALVRVVENEKAGGSDGGGFPS